MYSTIKRAGGFWRTLFAMVLVTACGGEKIMQVELDPATIALDLQVVAFAVMEGDPDPDPASVRISMGGGQASPALSASVEFAAGSGTGWLTASLDRTSVPATMSVAALTAGLAPGTYRATVLVQASGVTNSPQAVGVTLAVEAGPRISLATSDVSFVAVAGDVDPAVQYIDVDNDGGGSLSGLTANVRYGAGQATGWLDFALDGSTAPARLGLGPLTGSLALGTYTATVFVESADALGGPATLDVHLEIVDTAPRITASRFFVTFNATTGQAAPPAQTVEVTNAGGGTLTGLELGIRGVTPPGGWLLFSLDRTTAPAVLTMSVLPDLLPAGQYDAEIDISSTLGVNEISVEVSLAVDLGLPDLTVEGTLTGSADAGTYMRLPRVTVANQGSAPASDIRIGYYLSADSTITVDDRFLEAARPITGLGAGVETRSAGADSVAIPSDVAPGDYYLGVLVDHIEAIEESDESNNFVSSPVTITEPAAETYTLTVTVTPRGGGRVTRSPSASAYDAGSVVRLSATPSTGYAFDAWSGDASGSNTSATVTMDRDMTVTANFSIVRPVLQGSASGSAVELTWSHEWPCDFPFGRGCLSTTQDHYELEESTTSSKSGFRRIFVSNTTRTSPFTYVLNRDPGTYYYRVRAFGSGWVSSYSTAIAVTVIAPPRVGPAPPSGLVASVSNATVTISWTDNSSDETGFRVHLSEQSDFSTISPFGYVANTTTAQFDDPAAPSTWYLRVVAFNAEGQSAPSNAVVVNTTASPTLARFVNNTSYAVISIRIDGVEQIPQNYQLASGDTYQIELSAGSHDFYMSNGLWIDGVRNELHTWSGSFTQVSGEPVDIVFPDPTARELMTRYARSGIWIGSFVDGNSILRVTELQFSTNGFYSYLVDGAVVGSGTYATSTRAPFVFTVDIGMSGFSSPGTLWETFAFFSLEVLPGVYVDFRNTEDLP